MRKTMMIWELEAQLAADALFLYRLTYNMHDGV